MNQIICCVTHVPAEGAARVFDVFGREVQVWRSKDHICATANVCLRLGGPLECKDSAFVCPWHGARFDTAEGRHIEGLAPSDARLLILPTRIKRHALVHVWGEPS